MREKRISIVVPSYNVEDTLGQTLDSILNTQYVYDVEVIIVNDGSKDNTEKVAQKYVRDFPGSVRLINKENGGHGSTINIGIEEASGEYFKVIDGDDWVDRNGWNEFLRKLRSIDSDIVVTNYYEVNDGTKQKTEVVLGNKNLYGKNKKFNEIYEVCDIPMHGLTIRTSILKGNKITIDENCFYVDMEFILLPIPFVDTAVFLEDFVYMYRVAQENQSISSKGWMMHRNDHVKVVKRLLSELNSDACKNSKKENFLYFEKRVLRSLIARFFLGFKFEKQIISEYLLEQRELDKFVKKNNKYLYDKCNQNFFVSAIRRSNYNTQLYLAFRGCWKIQRLIRRKTY